MNIKELMESGIIESYVLGSLDSNKVQELELLAEQYPEVRKEIEAQRSALENYAQNFQTPPPPALKNQIWEKIASDSTQESPLNISHSLPTSQRSERKSKSFNAQPYYPVAASIVLAISLFGNLFLYQKWQNSKSELQLARLEKVQYTQDLKRVQTNNTQLAQELSFITQPNNKLIRLSGSEIYPEAKVTVFWNPNDKKLYISVLDLPEPPKGKQYQLWAVHGEEVLDAGVFEIGDESQNLQAMLDIAEADQFIITLEKRGGVPVAEGQAYAFGEVS